MLKPFLYGGNHFVDDAHVSFFQNTDSSQRNKFLRLTVMEILKLTIVTSKFLLESQFLKSAVTPYPVFQPREEQEPGANYGWGQ